MNHYGTLRDYRFADKDVDDIRGSAIYGVNDEKLGKIDDVIFDHSTGDIRYVVVDSGGWLSTKKFLVPAERLRPSTKYDNDYQVDLTKAQIEQFPSYNEKEVDDADRWREYDDRYQKVMVTDGGVMHRADAPDRIVTPPHDEVIASTSTSRISQPVARTASANDAGYVGGSRTHLGQRWNNFEDRIRRDRTHIASSCNVCKFTPESSSTVERDRARKVS
ncbi:MAG: PRC-barrel domain-containing protein [Terriglobales bacterium]